jgi:hypothetical protein
MIGIFIPLKMKDKILTDIIIMETIVQFIEFLFIVWLLYGIAYLFNYKYRNVSYNILDIFSKNFYGLYIFYKILKKKRIRN